MAYFVKWRGYPESENSWVREQDAPYVPLVFAVSFGAHDSDLCRNADELISKFLDEKRAREKAAAKKAGVKPRKSTEPRKQEPKKRGRLSTKSKVDSDEEEPEKSPVRPSAKKQKKEKAPTSTRKRVERTPEEDGLEPAQFTSMDKYMHVDSWEEFVDKIDTIERDDDAGLIIYGTL